MPLKVTLSRIKGVQTIEATDVKQLENADARVGDTLHLSSTDIYNIHTQGSWNVQPATPFTPFDYLQIAWNDACALPLPGSSLMSKATALIQAADRQLHPEPDDDSRISAPLCSVIQKSDIVLLSDFSEITLKTADLCTAKDECVYLKDALTSLSNNKNWTALMKQTNASKPDGVDVLLRPVDAKSPDNLMNTSTALSISHEIMQVVQTLSSPASNDFPITNDEDSDLVDQP